VLYTEFRAAFYDAPTRPAMINFIGGLGGREFTAKDGQEMFGLLQRAVAGELKENVHWIGVRE
jgi:pyruvate ferredoxin oxidoreductase alpha subunit